MILMSPPLRPGKSPEEREEFLRKVRTMDVRTVTFGTPPDWPDDEVEETRRFLDDHGIRAGEFIKFYKGATRRGGLGAYDEADHKAGIAHYARGMRHARILGSHCVGFSTYIGRGTPHMWTRETWDRTVASISELVEEAEKAGVVVAGHPHIMSPLNSVERYRELLDAVDSPMLKILMDPVNMVWPQMVFRTTELINEIFDELGESIVALHAKDVTISGGGGTRAQKGPPERPGLGVVLVDEAVPGRGFLDYSTLLRRLDRLGHDVTVHVEHFGYENTIEGQQFIRSVAREVGVTLN